MIYIIVYFLAYIQEKIVQSKMKHMKDSSSSFTIVVMYAFVIVVSDGLISGCWFSTCLTKI